MMKAVRNGFFFDSHGGLWETCRATAPGAVAFGPTGVSRPRDNRAAGLPRAEGRSAWAVAKAAGRVGERDGWSVIE